MFALIRAWFGKISKPTTRPGRSSKRFWTPMFEVLEDRTAPTVEAISLADPSLISLSGGSHSYVYENAISADGRYVVFHSLAPNLVANDSNNAFDVFVRDLHTGEASLITTGSLGQANNLSEFPHIEPVISPDGRLVAFHSAATNLVPGTSGQLYIKDLQSDEISVLSSGPDGVANSSSSKPVFSADSRYVAFESFATNLAPAGNGNYSQVFLKDLHTGEVQLVSSGPNGPGNGESEEPSISGDGRYVTFISLASNFGTGDVSNVRDIFVKDLHTGEVALVSTAPNGPANQSSYSPIISQDGRFVAFNSSATNLSSSTSRYGAYIKDLESGSLQLVNTEDDGGLYATSGIVAMSPDARLVLLRTDQPAPHELILKDLVTGSISTVPYIYQPAFVSSSAFSMTPDGRYIVFGTASSDITPNDFNTALDVFVFDTYTRQTSLVSARHPELPSTVASGHSRNPNVSADGRFIAFTSDAFDLTGESGINGNYPDLYIYDVVNDSLNRVSLEGYTPNKPHLSADGRYVLFRQGEIYLVDLQTGNTTVASLDSEGRSYGPMGKFVLSPNARYLAFTGEGISPAHAHSTYTHLFVKDLVTGEVVQVDGLDENPYSNAGSPVFSKDGRFLAFGRSGDIVIRDLSTGELILASTNADGEPIRVGSAPALSGDGRYVAFVAHQDGVVPGDTNARQDLFVKDLHTGSIVLVSDDPTYTSINSPVLSEDGRYISFLARTGEVDPASGRAIQQLFMKDLQTGELTIVSSGADGPGNNYTNSYSMSSDGRVIVFDSSSYNLVPGDWNNRTDVFISIQDESPPQQSLHSAINAGSGAADPFQADAGFIGGKTYRTAAPIDVNAVAGPADQVVYQSVRYGNFSYQLTGLTSGNRYTVRLHFAEIYWDEAGRRLFDVAINDLTVLNDFDVYSDAGGKNRAIVREFAATADPDGKIVIGFDSVRDQAKVSGIELLFRNSDNPIPPAPEELTASAGDGQVLVGWNAVAGSTGYNLYRSTVSHDSGVPYRTGLTSISFVDTEVINGTTYFYWVSAVNGAGESSLSGSVAATPAAAVVANVPIWSVDVGNAASDTGFSGGRTYRTGAVIEASSVTDAAPPAWYQSERYGNFTYTAAGLDAGSTYTVRLHFAEIYWNEAGRRLFDVSINGLDVLTGFDVYAEAGGKFQALVRDFTVTADAAGVIAIGFESVKDNAKLSGIELLAALPDSLPSAPSDLTALAGDRQVLLEWNAVAGATSYNLYRSTSATMPGNPYRTGIAGTTFNDMAAANGTTYHYWVTAVNSTGEGEPSNQTSALPATVDLIPILFIDAGSPSGDSSYSGGKTFRSSADIDAADPLAAVPALYQTVRYGNFAYTQSGLEAGTSYTVRLHFAEIYWSQAGRRLFDVAINDVDVLTSFDIFSEAGQKNKAIVREFVVSADDDGTLRIEFTSVNDHAMISGIEILAPSGA